MGVLTVVLEKITHLRDEDGIGKSDPYVKFHLEKDNWFFDKSLGKYSETVIRKSHTADLTPRFRTTVGKYTSSKKKNDLNPVYGETFEFPNIDSLENMVLHVKVMDDDFGIDDSLGGCDIKLEKMGLTEEPVDVEKVIDNKKGEGWFSRKAKIYLKISYKAE